MSTGAAEESERIPLSRARVLEAAVAYADEHGVAALSMRKLAAELGFEAMSLYNHVANKDDLFEGMADLVAAEVELPDADTDWKAGVRAIAVAHHRALLRHPWAGPVQSIHFPGPARWQISERILELLTAGGFTDHLRDVGFHAVTLHIAGFTQQQIAYSFDEADAQTALERVQREITPESHPQMYDHIRYHIEYDDLPGERPDEFEFVLDLILDGLERRRDA